MTNRRVLVVGDVMQDIVVRPEGAMRPGTDQRASIAVMPGGSGANQAGWLAHVGVPTRFLGCVAQADVGREAERLVALGVEAVLAGHPDLPTGRLIALVDANGERSFLTDRGANDWLSDANLPPGLLDGVGHLHVSGYAFVGPTTRATTLQLMADARRRGLTLSFDPGSAGFLHDQGATAVLDWAEGADLCVANGDEAAALTGRLEPAEQLRSLNEHFPLALLKQGAAGACARHADGRCWAMPAAAVAVVDTIGAGDAFLAGFLRGWLAGDDVEPSLSRAVALGGLAVGRAGGAPGWNRHTATNATA